ncbi:ABC transporter ATP-binding protein [Kallotenue papyrolyticum]|uniref:ABC transporter ATP-binding protein n=1 Tax=Kallotenue papyrolyticum TaxID=1325125 RepID=UPI0004786751|nr:ABC transporter ATP-binding protein [Kallotenue papyrolyticum]
MSDTHAAIETYGLSKAFGGRQAVDALNLSIPQGAIFGFLGPNGAGKTTTMRMLLGLIHPTAGSARILGHDIISERAAIVRQVGAIVEAPAFYPYLSGRDNLRILARVLGVAERRIDEVLELVDLTTRARDRVKTYSLGMKQRLAIAAALLNQPRIVFLDEPTNGLDPAGTVEIRDLIRRLGGEGHTIFLSSHLLNEVEQVCTHVAIIHQGRLVAQGPVAELLQQDAALLVAAEPLALLQAVVERLGIASTLAGEQALQVALEPQRTPELVAALVQAGARVLQVTPVRASLEERFLALTGAARANGTSHVLAEMAHAMEA